METAIAIKITAKELRFGNWIRTLTAYDAPREIQVHSIEATTINGNIPFDDLEGIQLTGEMLVKYGFEKTPEANGYVNNKSGYSVVIITRGFGFQYCTLGNNKWFAQGRLIRFVHQLQNLIYDLTGTEL